MPFGIRLAFIASVAVLQVGALVLAILLVLLLGPEQGFVWAVILVLVAPVVWALAGRRLLRRRLAVSRLLVVAPVWILVAAMWAKGTTFWDLVKGDVVRLEPLALILATAILGAVLGTVQRLASRIP